MAAVLGPTASGKSSLAEHLALSAGGELLNSDASAVYRELSVGVTKPNPETRARLRYHLLDLTTLERGFSLMEYLQTANGVIRDVHSRGRLPILVGGSGLYARALLDGYRPPEIEVDEATRSFVRALPPARARAMLAERDPGAYARVDLANPRRVARALELALAHGSPLPPPVQQPRHDLRVLRFYLLPGKSVLERRIRARTADMWDGWLEEVDQLEKKGLIRWLDVRKPIGYGFVLAFKRGEMSRDEAIESIVKGTVKLARKQKTWLKRETQHPDSHRFLLDHEEQWSQVPEQALRLLQRFLA